MNVHNIIIAETAPESAFLTDDPIEILRYARDSFRNGVAVALVTLVEIRGGAARPLGAQMCVRMDGLYCGFVSGGCTEAAVAAEAIQALHTGHDRFLCLGEGSPFIDIVLPCGGGIRLAIHVVKNVDAIELVLAKLDTRQPAGLVYRAEAEEIGCDDVAATGWNGSAFAVRYEPALQIVLCGRSLEVETTLGVARAAGYLVRRIERGDASVVDGTAFDAHTAVAILYHDIESEMPLLRRALASQAFYIGALGSRRTHTKRCAALRDLGHGDDEIARIKAPIGIFDRARDAASIALSVIADIAAARNGIRSAAGGR